MFPYGSTSPLRESVKNPRNTPESCEKRKQGAANIAIAIRQQYFDGVLIIYQMIIYQAYATRSQKTAFFHNQYI